MEENNQPKPVAVISSPNTTAQFSVDIREEFVNSPLEGKIFYFKLKEGAEEKIILAQLFGLEGTNKWHEDPTFKAVIKKRGSFPYLSGVSDVKSAELELLGAFQELSDSTASAENTKKKDSKTTQTYKRAILYTPPPSGSDVYEVTPELIKSLVASEEGIAFIGYVYGSATNTPVPMYVRHFGPTDKGGFGEAYHFGVFGQTGQGKSIFAAQLIAAMAGNVGTNQLGILIIDPAGEFSNDSFGMQDSKLNFKLHSLLKKAGRVITSVDISKIQLENTGTFSEMLRRNDVFKELGFLKADKQEQITEEFAVNLHEYLTSSTPVGSLTYEQFESDLIPLIAERARFIYADKKKQDEVIERAKASKVLKTKFLRAIAPFLQASDKTPLSQLIGKFYKNKDIIFLNLRDFEGGNKDAQAFLINEILYHIRRVAYATYKEGDLANCLVVLDEANEFVPQHEDISHEKGKTREFLIHSVRETRKFGVGWFFIAQTIADFHKDIYRQLHNRIYGWGLGIGADKPNLEAVVGKQAAEQYSFLPSPKQSGIYSFLLSGPILALGTTGRPIIVRAFASSEEMISANPHIFKK